MKKHNWIVLCVCCVMFFFFVCSALIPAYSACIIPPQVNGVKTFQELLVKKVAHADDDNQTFFDFAIIWGTFEHKVFKSLFREVIVYNRAPWYNDTMNVIGYLIPEHQWYFKKSYWIECNYRHVGIVGRNWLFVIGYGNIAAFG